MLFLYFFFGGGGGSRFLNLDLCINKWGCVIESLLGKKSNLFS